MGILNVCKVVTAIGQLKKDGTSALPADVAYYFQGSSAFNDPAFATCTGIEMIPADKWDGSHPLVPVAQLIAANILNRLSIVVQDTDKKKKRYDIVIQQEKVAKAIDGTAAEKLDGKSFKLINRAGATVNKGTVIRVGGNTTQYNP